MASYPNAMDYRQHTYPSPAPTPSAGGTKRGRDGKEKESFKCPHPGCGQSYSRMEYLKRHQRKHQDVRPFTCRDCDKSFARSDVLLRHRRRCHPTPPPEARSSRSPAPISRSYTGVPVSSSRNDSREYSPIREHRLHSRDEIGMTHGHSHNRRRTASDEEDDEAYILSNGQTGLSGDDQHQHHDQDQDHLNGSNGVYDIGGNYYDLGESSTYTPHLLPFLQSQNQHQNQGQRSTMTTQYPAQNPDDPNHLEDASVLLSMAYPGGVPGDGSGSASASGSGAGTGSKRGRTSRDGISGPQNGTDGLGMIAPELLPDWNGQNIDMMLDTAANDQVGNGGNPSSTRDVELGASVGSFLNTMGWLSESPTSAGAEGKDQNGANQNGWPTNNTSTTLNDAIDPSLTSTGPGPIVGVNAVGAYHARMLLDPSPTATTNDVPRPGSGSGSSNTGPTSTSSPFTLPNLFSPSIFGLTSLPPLTNSTDSSPIDGEDDLDNAIMAFNPGPNTGIGVNGNGHGNGIINNGLYPNAYGNGNAGYNGAIAHSAEVMSILDQLARFDSPQTASATAAATARASTNPERPLIRIDKNAVYSKQGRGILNPDSRFYVSPARFTSCYEIPHWRMPPIRVLSLMAAKTYHTVLNHFSFIHQPTFKLHDTAACLAFAICTVGGIRSSSTSASNSSVGRRDNWGRLLPHIDHTTATANLECSNVDTNPEGKKMDGPVVPEASWESIYEANYAGRARRGGSRMKRAGGRHAEQGEWNELAMLDNNSAEKLTALEEELDEERKMVEEWDTAGLVRNDKTNMLVKSFSQAKGVLMTEYNVALLQSLILYHAPYLLSESEQERAMANMFMGTIVNITRQIGFLTPELEHFEPQIRLPREPSTPNDLNLAWRRWIQLETRRRTAFLVYHLDTVSALEASISCILTSCELSDLPLPAPDTLWKAPTAEAWASAARSYRPITLDEAMRRIFFLPSYGAFDSMHEKASQSTKYYNLLNEQAFGPFARVAMVLTLVRGIMDIGEGRRDRGDWRDLTDLWIGCAWLKPGKKMLDGDGREVGEVSREGLRGRFGMALDRWRQGWDFDPLCLNRTGDDPKTGSTPQTLMYCEEALPFYWLAQALLSILNSSPSHLASLNAFQGIKYGEMLKSARTFTRLGEGAGAISAMGCPVTTALNTGSNSIPYAPVSVAQTQTQDQSKNGHSSHSNGNANGNGLDNSIGNANINGNGHIDPAYLNGNFADFASMLGLTNDGAAGGVGVGVGNGDGGVGAFEGIDFGMLGDMSMGMDMGLDGMGLNLPN